jgi:Xaa-Pro dipeptidase
MIPHDLYGAPARIVLLALLALLGVGTGCAPQESAPHGPDDPNFWAAAPELAASGLRLGPPAFDTPLAWAGPGLPFPPQENPWPAIRDARIRTLLGPAMDRAGVEAWIVFLRENHNDPLAPHVGGDNAGGLAAFLFFRDESGRGGSIYAHALSPGGEAVALRETGLFDEVEVLAGGESAWVAAARLLEARSPERIAINVSQLAVADGLSHTQHQALLAALSPPLRARLISSEELVIQWLSVKTEQEAEILTRAAEVTAALELEAYSRVVPGHTTDADVASYLKARMAQLGVGDAWAPDQNPNVNSGADRGHSHATDRVIQSGDVIQTDFGIRVWDRWVTDLQRFAYVLGEGETAAPPAMEARWQAARRGLEAAFHAMRPGVPGVEVDRAQRTVMDAEGSLDVFWSTGHPVGYWAHDVGPSLGGAQRGRTPSIHAQRPLLAGQLFAFDGFFSWYLDEAPPGPEFPAVDPSRPTKTFSVEEMVVITPEGARWLVPPQSSLVLIPRR